MGIRCRNIYRRYNTHVPSPRVDQIIFNRFELSIVKTGWENEVISSFEGVAKEVAYCCKLLSIWNREVFRNINHSIKLKEAELEKLLHYVKDDSNAIAIDNCRMELIELSAREEILWKQRAKISWLKEGDRNMRYFHGVATRRRRNNKNQDGEYNVFS